MPNLHLSTPVGGKAQGGLSSIWSLAGTGTQEGTKGKSGVGAGSCVSGRGPRGVKGRKTLRKVLLPNVAKLWGGSSFLSCPPPPSKDSDPGEHIPPQ